MTLVVLGLDHTAVPVAGREPFLLDPPALARVRRDLAGRGLPRVFGLSTCNRVELYADAARPDRAWAALAGAWGGPGERAAWLAAHGVRREGLDAAGHLLRVAAGLESQVAGDRQIRGQLRRAYAANRRLGDLGPVLARVLETALRAGRRAGLVLGDDASTAGARAVAVAQERAGGLAGRRVVVLGAGAVGADAARRLAAAGVLDLVLVNRTPERALAVARPLGARVASLPALAAELGRADVAVLAAGGPAPLVAAATLAGARRRTAPLLVLDLAVPRAAEPAVAALPGVELITLEAMPGPGAGDPAAVRLAEEVVAEELERLAAWLEAERAREAIRPLQEALAGVCRREVAYAVGPDAGERMARRIAGRLLAHPMQALRRELAGGGSVDAVAASLRLLFPEGR